MPGRRTPFNHSLSAVTIAPALFATDFAVVTGVTVDRLRRGTTDKRLQFFGSAMLSVVAGVVDSGTHAFKLQHSDDDSVWDDVPAAELQGPDISVAPTDDNKTFDQGYVGHKRFLRAVLTVGDFALSEDAALGAVIILDSVESPPVDR